MMFMIRNNCRFGTMCTMTTFQNWCYDKMYHQPLQLKIVVNMGAPLMTSSSSFPVDKFLRAINGLWAIQYVNIPCLQL